MRIGRGVKLVLVLAVIGAGLFGAWRRSEVDLAEREAGIERSSLRAWARAETNAGVSIIPKQVPAADEREIRRLENVAGFHDYAMRCSSCHVLPDPAAYPAGQWARKVDDMRYYIGRAGVLPPAEAELKAATTFLDSAAAVLRKDGRSR